MHACVQGAPLSAVTALTKVSHPTPMTSLAAVRDESELRAWGSRLGKQGVINPVAVDWVVEPKVDGLAVRVVYRCASGVCWACFSMDDAQSSSCVCCGVRCLDLYDSTRPTTC
jgi:hypothetical protein